MPDLKLGLNDKIDLEKESQLKSRPSESGKTIELDDVTFRQNSGKTVSFVPPDGEFELMKYRITEGVNLPFKVLPTIKELGRTRMEVNIKVPMSPASGLRVRSLKASNPTKSVSLFISHELAAHFKLDGHSVIA